MSIPISEWLRLKSIFGGAGGGGGGSLISACNWVDRPNPVGAQNTLISVKDLNNAVFVSDNNYWYPLNTQRIIEYGKIQGGGIQVAGSGAGASAIFVPTGYTLPANLIAPGVIITVRAVFRRATVGVSGASVSIQLGPNADATDVSINTLTFGSTAAFAIGAIGSRMFSSGTAMFAQANVESAYTGNSAFAIDLAQTVFNPAIVQKLTIMLSATASGWPAGQTGELIQLFVDVAKQRS